MGMTVNARRSAAHSALEHEEVDVGLEAEATAEIRKRKNGQWTVTLIRHGNHKKINWTEHYRRRVDAIKACRWFHPELVCIEQVTGAGKTIQRIRIDRRTVDLL
jgi:uncharacterized protein YegP (UPF0339 family)